MSHELGTEARVIQDLRAEITKREKKIMIFLMRRFFTKRIHIYFLTAASGALKLPTTAKRVSCEIAYKSCDEIYQSAHFLAGNCELTLRESNMGFVPLGISRCSTSLPPRFSQCREFLIEYYDISKTRCSIEKPLK